jgi:hypothetical protein
MGWEIRPRGRQWVLVALVLSPVFLALGFLILFPLVVPHGWRSWLFAYAVGVAVVVGAALSRRS